MKTQVSTQTLFHYTNLEAAKSILSLRGFRFSLQKEEIPYRKHPFKQTNYAISFCDLPSSDSPHLRRTRPIGIGLMKEWGLKHRVSPVRYIHAESVGLNDTYMTLKNLHRLEERVPEPYRSNRDWLQKVQASVLRFLSDQYGDGTPMDPTAINLQHSTVEKYMQELHLIANGNDPLSAAMQHTFSALMWTIRHLHNELESRDSYVRSHEEIASDGSKIQIYDEREWRAVSDHGFEGDEMIDLASGGRFLKDSCNLNFTEEDIVSIVVATLEQFQAITTTLATNGLMSLLDKISVVPIPASQR